MSDVGGIFSQETQTRDGKKIQQSIKYIYNEMILTVSIALAHSCHDFTSHCGIDLKLDILSKPPIISDYFVRWLIAIDTVYCIFHFAKEISNIFIDKNVIMQS
jgi:hypothetical protein